MRNLYLILLENNNNKPDEQLEPRSIMRQLQHTGNSVYQQKSASHLQAFYYSLLGTPVVSALIQAINNNWLISFPGLTAAGVQRHLPKSVQTTMGYNMHKVRQNIDQQKR